MISLLNSPVDIVMPTFSVLQQLSMPNLLLGRETKDTGNTETRNTYLATDSAVLDLPRRNGVSSIKPWPFASHCDSLLSPYVTLYSALFNNPYILTDSRVMHNA